MIMTRRRALVDGTKGNAKGICRCLIIIEYSELLLLQCQSYIFGISLTW